MIVPLYTITLNNKPLSTTVASMNVGNETYSIYQLAIIDQTIVWTIMNHNYQPLIILNHGDSAFLSVTIRPKPSIPIHNCDELYSFESLLTVIDHYCHDEPFLPIGY